MDTLFSMPEYEAEVTDNVRTITVYGPPCGQPRPKAAAIAGKARMYTPKGAHDVLKAQLKLMAGPLFSSPIDGPVAIEIEAYFPRAKTRMRKNSVLEPHVQKPDFDNVSKAITDALTGVAYTDDAQIWRCVFSKYMLGREGAPKTIVRITG